MNEKGYRPYRLPSGKYAVVGSVGDGHCMKMTERTFATYEEAKKESIALYKAHRRSSLAGIKTV